MIKSSNSPGLSSYQYSTALSLLSSTSESTVNKFFYLNPTGISIHVTGNQSIVQIQINTILHAVDDIVVSSNILSTSRIVPFACKSLISSTTKFVITPCNISYELEPRIR